MRFDPLLALTVMLAVIVWLLVFWKRTETYANDDQPYDTIGGKVIYTEQPLVKTLLYKPKKMLYIDAPLDSLKRMSVYRPTIQIGVPPKAADALSFTDAYTFAHDVLPTQPGAVVVTMMPTPDARALLFLQKGSLGNMKQADGLKFGVAGAIPKSLALIVTKAYGITATFVEFESVDALLAASTVDVMVVFVGKDEPDMAVVADRMASQLSPVPYDDVPMQVVRIWLPTCKKDLYTVQKKLPVSQDGAGGTAGMPPATTMSVITIDTLLYAMEDLGDNPNVVDVIDYLNQPSKNSHFTKYFKFHQQAIDAIRDYQSHVIEGFDAPGPVRSNPNFTVHDTVEGTHVYVPLGDYYELHCAPGLRLNGLRARMGDRVLLQGQARDIENAYYYVIAANTDETLLSTALVLKSATELESKAAVADEVWVTDTQERGTMTTTGLVTRQATKSALGQARCVEDPTLMTEEACAQKTWDAPCVRDDACPYFKGAASHYRGGCNPSGYCEMPLGVTRVGYTKTSGRPFYTGCPIEKADTCKDGDLTFDQ